MSVDERLQDYVTRPLPEILSDLVQQKASGILTAMGAEAHRGIVLIDGEVKAARSTMENEKLGLFLVEKQWLDEKDRAQALLTQASANAPPLGEVLISRGFISASELENELQELALTIIRRAATDSTAYSEFFDEPEGVHLDTLTFMTTTQVLLNVARAFEDDKAKSRFLGDRNHRVKPTGNLEHLLADLDVTPTEAFVLSRTDDRPRLQDLIHGASMPEEKAVATVYTLIIAGLIITYQDNEDFARSETEAEDTAELGWNDQELSERVEIERMATLAPRTDHYQALGLPRTATDEEIIDAWSSIRQRFAITRTSEPHLRDARTWLEKIQDRAQDAYQVLGDPAMRQRYDKVLAGVDRDRDRHRERQEGQPRVTEVDRDARVSLVEANLKRADELIRDGEIFSALQMLEQACAIDARPAALLKLAQLQLKNPKWDIKALRTLQKALEVDPDCIEVWLELVDFWQRRNDPERCRKALEKVLSLDPNHPKGREHKALLTTNTPMSRLRDLFRLKK